MKKIWHIQERFFTVGVILLFCGFRSYAVSLSEGNNNEYIVISVEKTFSSPNNHLIFNSEDIFTRSTENEFDPKVIAGKWKWVGGQELEIFANGTSKTWLNGVQINSGTWVCNDKILRSYTFRLDQGGWVDQVALSIDYNTINGKNQQGSVLSGTRISHAMVFDPKVIAGKWKWVEGQELEIFANGTSKTWLNGVQINSGTWVCNDNILRSYTFRLDQGGWVDQVALSADYNTINGKNQQGSVLSGTRISHAMVFDPKVIAGKWKWVGGQELEIFANGTSKTWLNGVQINSGTWVCNDKILQSYTFRLDQGGWVDQVALSADYNTISGKNQQGSVLSGSRIK